MHKLSISNIAWDYKYDAEMYHALKHYGYHGLEIAPTRIFPDSPYEKLGEAKDWAEKIKSEYGLVVSSMQSIWYKRQEKIFGTQEERRSLIDYTKKAILFAEAIGCKNLVFGNPRNRDTTNIEHDIIIAIDFFREIGDYAQEHNTVVALEPNPIIYNTHFLNYTKQAVEMVNIICSDGIKVNVDLGTIIFNGEDIDYLKMISEYINHVHISEPGLNLIRKRDLHNQLFEILGKINYNRFVSIEMGNKGDLQTIKNIMKYVKELSYEV